MKERPILFSAPMVRAILEGRKTVTRRAIKVQPHIDTSGNFCVGRSNYGQDLDGKPVTKHFIKDCCPYGQPGDRLWVRETFYAFGRWITRFSAKKGRDEWHFVDMTLECGHAYLYDADAPNVPLAPGRGAVTPGWYKRPAIFMPRSACRIQSDITDVRAERLQDISEEQAKAEGVRPMRDDSGTWVSREGPGNLVTPWPTAKEAFHDLWNSINGPEAWDANPWVWAVSFRRVDA